jgi:hypothetical protein
MDVIGGNKKGIRKFSSKTSKKRPLGNLMKGYDL